MLVAAPNGGGSAAELSRRVEIVPLFSVPKNLPNQLLEARGGRPGFLSSSFMRPALVVLLQVGVATAFAPLGTGRPREVTRLQSQSVGQEGVVAEKLLEAAAQVPETLRLAVESTPRSVYQAMFTTGVTAWILGWHFAPELTNDYANVIRTLMWGGAFGTYQDGFHHTQRQIALQLDKEPIVYKRRCAKSLADEISAFTKRRSDKFFVFTAEPGDVGLYSELQSDVVTVPTYASSFRDALLTKFGLTTDESLEDIGRKFAAVLGFRSMFLGGPFDDPFGALEYAVVVVELSSDAGEQTVKSILEETAAFKAGAGNAVELAVRVPQVPEEVPSTTHLSKCALQAYDARNDERHADRASVNVAAATAAAAAAAKPFFFFGHNKRRTKGATSFFLALRKRARRLGLSKEDLYDLQEVEELLVKKDRRAVDKALEIRADYLASSKDDAAQRFGLKAFALFGKNMLAEKNMRYEK